MEVEENVTNNDETSAAVDSKPEPATANIETPKVGSLVKFYPENPEDFNGFNGGNQDSEDGPKWVPAMVLQNFKLGTLVNLHMFIPFGEDRKFGSVDHISKKTGNSHSWDLL